MIRSNPFLQFTVESITRNNASVFNAIIERGQMKLVRWLLHQITPTVREKLETFERACLFERTGVMRAMSRLFPELCDARLAHTHSRWMADALSGGQMDVARWVQTQFNLDWDWSEAFTRLTRAYGSNGLRDRGVQVVDADAESERINATATQMMVDHLSPLAPELFVHLCANGRVHLAEYALKQWPELKTDPVVDARICTALANACMLDFVRTAMWISKTFTSSYCRVRILEQDRLSAAEIDPDSLDLVPSLSDIFGEVFITLCRSNDTVNAARWLLKLVGPTVIDIRRNQDEAFKTACARQCLDVARYLTTLCPTAYVINEPNAPSTMFTYTIQLELCDDRAIVPVTCSICYEKDSQMVTGCGHQYCIKCIYTWADKNRWATTTNTCPLCRAPIVVGDCRRFHT